jgi:outer membrane receptor protein involved in Fe transport
MAHSSAILQLRTLICVAGAALPALASASDAAAPPPGNPATAQELPQVTVIGNTPLAGLGLPVNEIPANVQTADSQALERQQTLSLAEFLNNNFSGVNVNESANNPFQLDINYHGFTASPLLGTPEGLSVYASTSHSATPSTGT